MEADDQLLQILKGTAKEEDSHGFCFTIAGIFFYSQPIRNRLVMSIYYH